MKLVPTLSLLVGSASLATMAVQEGTGRPGSQEERANGDEAPPTPPRPLPEDDESGVTETGNRNVGQLDVFGRRVDSPDDSIVDRIKGGWTLVAMDLEGSKKAGRVTSGFLHIGDAFVSMEIHAFWTGEVNSEFDIHSSFTAEYTVDATGRLYLRSVIGAYLDEITGLLEWERPGFPREYDISETDRELVLRWGGNRNKLVFRPRLPQMRRQVDIFGRQIPAGEGEVSFESDIFGRTQPDSGGVRDIFGRLVPPDEAEAGFEDPGDEESLDPREGPPPSADPRRPEGRRRTLTDEEYEERRREALRGDNRRRGGGR